MVFYKKKTFWYASIAVLVFITDIVVYLKLNGYPNPPNTITSAVPLNYPIKKKIPMGIAESSQTKDNSPTELLTSPSIVENIQETQNEILKRAQSLTESEIQKLAKLASDINENPDKRFESIYLLSQNGKIPLILKQVAETPLPKTDSITKIETEYLVRAQAIEGIEASNQKKNSKQIIRDLLLRTDDLFLIERLHRAQNTLMGQASSSEVQDNEQLKQILEN